MHLIQTTKSLIDALAHFARSGEETYRNDRLIAGGYRHWFDKALSGREIEAHELDSGTWIGQRLDSYADRGWEYLRLSSDAFALDFRTRYEAAAGQAMPDLTDPRNLIPQVLTAAHVASLFGRLIGGDNGKWVEHRIEAFLMAGNSLIGQKIERFAGTAYPAIFPTIRESGGGLSARFGGLELRAFVTAGRAMLTFARLDPKSGEVGLDLETVTCVASDSDQTGLTMGLQSVGATVAQAVALIEEIGKAILATPEGERGQILKPNQGVFFG